MSGQLSRHRLRDGQLIDVTLTLHPMRFQNRIAVLALVRDLTETKSLERELRRQSLHDSLTGLANRVLFLDRVEETLATTRSLGSVAVIILDLDGFKGVNDSLGHVAGDELLSQVSRRLGRCIRPGDMLARLGGDEFAILLPHLGKESDASAVAERLLAEVSKPLRVANRELSVSASLGIAFATADSSSEELLRNADVAMYVAKDAGRNRYELFEPSMHEQVVAAVALEADLRRAVEQDEITVYYQPLVDLATGELTGFEALARWIHPERGFVSPAQFIPLAEQTGLIVPIGQRILQIACQQAREWQVAYQGRSLIGMSVNLSGRQLRHSDIVSDVTRILAETALPAGSLTLEITESVLMEDLDVATRRLAKLKQLGVQLALDDFGTGYSSLSYLQRFPIDVIKIDKAFIDGMESRSSESALARSIIQLAEVLGLRVTAEGVEHAEQAHRLRELRCDTGQGYFFARPLPGKDAAKLVGRSTSGPAWPMFAELIAPRRSPEGTAARTH
jgi:diguanylate cyclase (GGDEF)-like protein